MDCNVIHKVKKLYRIHDALFKYNIFDKNAFDKDETFKYIIQHYDIEDDFHQLFQEKYSHEITQSSAYKVYCESRDEEDIQEEDIEEIQEDIQEEDIQEEEFESQKKNTTKLKSIKEIDKTMYKKIVIISHPDKSTDTDNIIIFKNASEYMNNDWTIGLVNCCNLLKIKLDFIYITDEIVDHCFKQMRDLIQEIIQLYNIRQSL